MAFMTSYSDLDERLPEGTYEMIISGAGEETDKFGNSRLSVTMVVRNDVQQDRQNYTFYHSLFKVKEPKPVDAQTCNYSYAMIMRIAQSAKLPENKQYQTFAEFLADIVNRPVKVDIYHDTYNGKTNARVKYWYATDVPDVKHKFKTAATTAAAAVPAPAPPTPTQSSALPWVK